LRLNGAFGPETIPAQLYGVRGQNAVATPLLLLLPSAVAITKRFPQSKLGDGSPSPRPEQLNRTTNGHELALMKTGDSKCSVRCSATHQSTSHEGLIRVDSSRKAGFVVPTESFRSGRGWGGGKGASNYYFPSAADLSRYR
jgi:hypothetical protein